MVDKRLLLALALAGCPVTESAFDQDGDGFVAVEAGGDDCDDRNPNIYPGAPEICGNGVDDNCDNLVDRVFAADGTGAPAAVMFGEIRVAQGTLYFLDEDRDGYGRDEIFVEECPVGGVIAGQTYYVEEPGDCNDTDPTVNPGAIDNQCDGVDSNCDGTPDSDVDPDTVWWPDRDGDRWGDDSNPARARLGCPPTDDPSIPRWSDQPGDCDDLNVNVNPGEPERCDGVDNNCSGRADDAVLGDGPQCPGESCADIHATRPETGSGEFWVGPTSSAVLGQCVEHPDHGRGWLRITSEWLRDERAIRFEVSPRGLPGYVTVWAETPEGTPAMHLQPVVWMPDSSLSRQANIDRAYSTEARAILDLPYPVTRAEGQWSLQAVRHTTPFHWGRDQNTAARWGARSPCNLGAVMFGTRETYLKQPGSFKASTGFNLWPGFPDADYDRKVYPSIITYRVARGASFAPASELRWGINDCVMYSEREAGWDFQPAVFADTGGYIRDIDIYVK